MKILRTSTEIAFTFALTLALAMSLSVSKDGAMALPKSTCADVCETFTTNLNGEMKVCHRYCSESGAYTMFCV